MSLEIGDELLEKIRRHASDQYPHECCGLILGTADGDRKHAMDLSPQENTREDSPRNRYLIAPRAMLLAEREARGRGLDIIGIYHSHPDHPARPSEFDRENAVPWYSYIIVSVSADSARDLTCWVLSDDRTVFREESLLGHSRAQTAATGGV
jgi:proteasome lid subunit RPN8/RPN11